MTVGDVGRDHVVLGGAHGDSDDVAGECVARDVAGDGGGDAPRGAGGAVGSLRFLLYQLGALRKVSLFGHFYQ